MPLPPQPSRGEEIQVGRIIGSSSAIAKLREAISRVGSTDASVLILGETGTGKELVASSVHALSARLKNVFLPVNMAALPPTLAESVLFGHVKGAFTGAVVDQKGWCELADRGTLFLDEITEMEMQLQAKLLRFLQEGTFQRVGSGSTQWVDVRVIAATNADPALAINAGKLRIDLYYRLNVVPIHVPSLRERTEDIPELVDWFLAQMRRKYPDSCTRISHEAVSMLQYYRWPGNVRELENLIERLTVFSPGSVIQVNDLPAEIVSNSVTGETLPVPSSQGALRPIDRMEFVAINDALRKTNGNVLLTARLLGIGQATVYRKIKRYGIALSAHRNKSAN